MDRLGKKGLLEQVQFETIMELVLAAIVGISLFVYVSNVSSNSVFEQNFMARDIGLLMDTLHAAPGDVNYVYDTTIAEKKLPSQEYTPFKYFPETKFSFLFKPSLVDVYTTEFNSEKPAEYYFGIDSKIKFDSTDRLKYNLILNKQKEEIKVTSIEQVTQDEADS